MCVAVERMGCVGGKTRLFHLVDTRFNVLWVLKTIFVGEPTSPTCDATPCVTSMAENRSAAHNLTRYIFVRRSLVTTTFCFDAQLVVRDWQIENNTIIAHRIVAILINKQHSQRVNPTWPYKEL